MRPHWRWAHPAKSWAATLAGRCRTASTAAPAPGSSRPSRLGPGSARGRRAGEGGPLAQPAPAGNTVACSIPTVCRIETCLSDDEGSKSGASGNRGDDPSRALASVVTSGFPPGAGRRPPVGAPKFQAQCNNFPGPGAEPASAAALGRPPLASTLRHAVVAMRAASQPARPGEALVIAGAGLTLDCATWPPIARCSPSLPAST